MIILNVIPITIIKHIVNYSTIDSPKHVIKILENIEPTEHIIFAKIVLT